MLNALSAFLDGRGITPKMHAIELSTELQGMQRSLLPLGGRHAVDYLT